MGRMSKAVGDRRRLSSPAKRCRPFPAFSPFARFLLFSLVPKAPSPAPSPSKTHGDEGAVRQKPTKRIKRIESSDEDSDEDDEYDEDEEQRQEEEGGIETVQADFAFFDPKPGDFHGVKLLLQKYLDDKEWDLSGFVDLILEQTTVGTVVKLENDDRNDDKDDDDGAAGKADDDAGPFAVISALNLGRYADHRCIREMGKVLLQACSEPSTKTRLRQFLEEQARDVGLLVSQRFINCPHELVPPLYDALFDEVSWATEDEPTQELRESFQFKYYLLITRIFEHTHQQKAKGKNSPDEPVIYVKPEDEIFRELSTLSFTFPLHLEDLVPRELKNYKAKGLVMVIKADEVPKFREKLKVLLAES